MATARLSRIQCQYLVLGQVDVAAMDGAGPVVADDGGHVLRDVDSEYVAIPVRAVEVSVLVLIAVEVPNFSTSNARPRPPDTSRTCRRLSAHDGRPSYLWMRSACRLLVLSQ